MTSGSNNYDDFPETVPTREITTKIEKTFLFFRPWPWSWAYFLNEPNAAASIAPTLIGHWWEFGRHCLWQVAGASIQISGDMLPNSTERLVTVSGSVDAVTRGILQICTVMLEVGGCLCRS